MDWFTYREFVNVFWPLVKLVAGLAAGLLLASWLETSRWADWLAKLATPLARLARLGSAASAAFALAFVSPAGANGLLAENYENGKISKRELVLANLFNGFPAFFTHAPSLFFLTWPALGSYACVYVGASLVAAVLRTLFTLLLARALLPARGALAEIARARKRRALRETFAAAFKRFRKRLPKLVYYTVPFYLLMYAGQRLGFFRDFENWLASGLDWLTFIRPQAAGIVVLGILAETGGVLGAAAASLTDGSLTGKDVVVAMLVGSALAAPMRAIRHQFPAYAGFFRPGLAFRLVLANQALKTLSMILVIVLCVFFWRCGE